MTDRQACVDMDKSDVLAPLRERFILTDGVVYLDGNSLGALPAATPARVAATVSDQWGRDLITSWNKHGWIDLGSRIGDKIGRLIGARPGETLAGDSTSVNLFKLAAAAVALRPGRRTILSDRGNFPSDLYIAQGLIQLLGQDYRLRLVDETEVVQAVDGDTALVMLTHVNYRSGWRHDMAAVTAAAHAAGALALWDLSHTAGAMACDLNDAGADFAVGCGYKYLNGGPGAPAFLWVAERHHAAVRPPVSGWFAHDQPFAFDLEFRPAAGIQRLACGTVPVLSMVALEVGIDLMLEVDMAALRAKSVALTELFIRLVDERCPGRFRLASPADPERRGSQVCIAHPEGYAIVQALIARGVIPDFRAPDILRFGVAPLYVRFADIWDAVDILADIMATGAWDRDEYKRRAAVT